MTSYKNVQYYKTQQEKKTVKILKKGNKILNLV